MPIFRQNGEDGFQEEEDNPIPQLFNIPVWISKKEPLRINFLEQD